MNLFPVSFNRLKGAFLKSWKTTDATTNSMAKVTVSSQYFLGICIGHSILLICFLHIFTSEVKDVYFSSIFLFFLHYFLVKVQSMYMVSISSRIMRRIAASVNWNSVINSYDHEWLCFNAWQIHYLTESIEKYTVIVIELYSIKTSPFTQLDHADQAA